MRTLVFFAVAVLAAGPVLAQTPSAAPIVAAERAFAADAPVLGLTASFNKWSVPDAVMIGGEVQTVRDVFPPDVPRPADEIRLEWWPNFAGISRSGDLGFTTGGVAVNGRRAGHYFTVWQKQPDGSWQWVYDGGSGASAADVPGPDSEPVILAPGPELLQVVTSLDRPPSPMAPDWAMNRVREEEAALARAAATDQKSAHLAVMADNGRLYVAPRPPAIGRDAFATALDSWPATFRFGPTEGGGQSRYGDLVWTYGPAAWTAEGQERTGHYVRLWQRQEAGFRIVLAQLIPAPPPAPPPAGG